MYPSKTWQFMPFLFALIIALAGCGGQAAAPVVEEAAVLDLAVNLDPAAVEALYQRDDVVILDVREDHEYQAGHIPGATLVPLGQIPSRLDEIPKDKTVIAVCRSGNRSNQATNFLRQQGFENVHNMTGGMNGWSRAGYKVEK